MKVNAAKTQVMVFGSWQNLRLCPDINVKFGGNTIKPCLETKNLGVTFDRSLTWDSHVSVISRRCFGILAGLSHLRHHIPGRALETLVSALVLPHVRYCITVYGNGSQTNLNRVQKIINFAARVISGRRKFDRVSDVRERLGWMTADEMHQHRTLCQLHNILSLGEPESLASEFRTNSSRRDRKTRQDDLLHIPRSNLKAGKRMFTRRTPLWYNKLPADLKDLPVRRFSRGLKKHMSTR